MKPAVVALLLAGCQLGISSSELHPSVQQLPASADDSEGAKRDALAQTVQRDLDCARTEIVLVLERRYVNTAAPRYVVEACGTRATYAETCETYPQCRYVLLSTVPAQREVPVPSARPEPPRPPPAPVSSAPSPLDLALDAGPPPPKFL